MTEDSPVIELLDERKGENSFRIWAYLDAEGDLHIDGQDFGPITAVMTDDGEYEYCQKFANADLPRVIQALGGQLGCDVLELLARAWSGERAHDLERCIREAGIPRKNFFSC
jgi:hypothetical protein